MSPLRYVPYHKLKGTPNIVVDGAGNPSTVLTLSHWPKSRTPKELMADTSTEIVLNYLVSPRREEYRAGAEVATNNHFDEDGLTALWAILHPEEASEMRGILIDIATAGDFSILRTPLAAKVAFTIHAHSESPTSPYAKAMDGLGIMDSTALLYEKLFPLLPDFIENIDRYEAFWRREWRELSEDLRLIDSGGAGIREIPEIDLAVVESPKPLHSMAVCSRTRMLRVLAFEGEGLYRVWYRYETWLQIASRKPMPRVDLTSLAQKLNRFEGGGDGGRWSFDGVATIHPHLWLIDRDSKQLRSRIGREEFLEEATNYLRGKASEPASLWNPYD